MRIIALASALLLLGATVALAQSSGNANSSGGGSSSGSSSGGSSGSSGVAAAAAAGAAAAGAHANSTTNAANPLAGATSGQASVSNSIPQAQYSPPQVMVNMSDGYPIQLFGTQLFSGSFAGTRPADHPDYLIQPGDQVVVNLYGAVNSGGTQVVDASGNIFVVGIGPIKVGGAPASNLNAVVTQAVGKVFTGAVSVYTAISNAGTIGVFVSGDVFRPGRFVGGTHDSILYFLNQAGGIDANGTYRAITVRRAGQVVATFDLYDFILKGDTPPFHFQEGDTIFVGPRGALVGATGILAIPYAFEAPPNAPMTGADLIRLSRPEPTQTGVVVHGYRNGAPRQAYFTMDEFSRVVLNEGDHVIFSASGILQTITVTIQGEVNGPGVFVMPRGSELSQLLARIPLEGTQIEPKWVHLQRASVAGQQKQAITDELYNLQKQVLTSSPPTNSAAQLATAQATLVAQFVSQAQNIQPTGNIAVYTNGQFHDMMLQDNDIVVLPNRTDVVLVTGEVLSPSGLAHADGMDIDGYVARAGGFAAHANKHKFVLMHPDGSGVVAGPHDRPQPGDQILVVPNIGNENLQVFIDLSQLLFQMVLSSATVISVAHTL
ncbi:MAG TPA: polysaccharide biosynthesis/export family protein [Caulobacteraceae bacterium]